MRKNIFLFIIFINLSLISGTVLAQEATSSISPTSKKTLRNELQLLESTTPAKLTPENENIPEELDSLLARLEAAVARLGKIREKMVVRLSLIEDAAKKKKLSSRYNRLVKQNDVLTKKLNSLYFELTQLRIAAESFLKAPELNKAYPKFRVKIISLNTLLKEIKTEQQKLVSGMRQIVPVDAEVTQGSPPPNL